MTRVTILVASLATLTARGAGAEPLFASPPHYVAGDGTHRIVLFLNEPVSGALAARGADGSYEIRVPRSSVDPSIQGQDFGSDGWGNGGDAVKHLVLATGPQGDTKIHIQPSAPLGGIDAHTDDDPPRLVIELLANAPTRTPVATRTPQKSAQPARTAAPKAQASSAPAAPASPASSKAPAATATPRPRPTATPKRTLQPTPQPTATTQVEPVTIAAAEPPTAAALAHATVLTALAPLDRAALAQADQARFAKTAAPPHDAAHDNAHDATHDTGHDAEPPAPAGGTVPVPAAAVPATAAAPHAPLAPAAGALAPPSALPRMPGSLSGVGLGCLWRRVSGLAFCAADPKAPPYIGDHTITALVGALARGKLPEPEDTPPVVTPALLFLQADVAFMTRAPEGKLLPVIDAYRRALRQHPEFPEAWRARLNIALAYRALEFRAESRTLAGEAAVDPTAGLVRGLVGDLAFVTGDPAAATEAYRKAADVGGLGACFASRGRARLALAQNDAATAAHEVAGLGSLCPTDLANDPETQWVRGRLAFAQGDLTTAKKMLGDAAAGLGKLDRGAVLIDLGAVAEAANDPKDARKGYEQLLDGAYGARAARQATVRLAILDGVGGDVDAGLKRLSRLTPEAGDAARRALVMQTARSALARGAAAEAIAALHEAHLDAAALPLADQLVMADAYRGIGLTGEAERVLAAAQANAGPNGSDALFAARGTLALERRDPALALAVVDEWIRVRGRTAGALGLKARAAALSGDAMGAHAAVAAAVIEDPTLARTLALDVAELLRERSPAAALVLAREALEPGPTPELPAARAATGLAMVGALAEAAGDDDTALAAFTTLTARYGKEPIAADAAYRAARLAARRVPGDAGTAFDEAAKSKDALARRVAGAARDYEAIVKPFGAPGGTP